ncbi:MAG: hypothetical protein ACOY0T_00155 [Myxococcota bacterium]
MKRLSSVGLLVSMIHLGCGAADSADLPSNDGASDLSNEPSSAARDGTNRPSDHVG